jgi:hypothetical protein
LHLLKETVMATSTIDISSYEIVEPVVESPTTVSHSVDATTQEFACTVVASDQTRREMLANNAKAAGWGVVHSCSKIEVNALMAEHNENLVIIDLTGSHSMADCRKAVEKLTGRHGMLLLVCGNEGDPSEEIWARGLGVWLYLPGVADDADLSSLCADALRISERNAPQMIELPAANRKLMRRAR